MLRCDPSTRTPTELVCTVPWAKLAEDTGNFGAGDAGWAALLLTRLFRGAMTVLI